MNFFQRKSVARIAGTALALAVLCFFSARVFSAEAEKKEEKKEIKYLGVASCKRCHADMDNGPEVWEKSLHAKAYESLALEKATKLSEKAQEDPKCLGCHVTGLGKAGGWAKDLDEKKRKNLQGVTCEMCHGPGQEYMKVMMKVNMGEEYDEKKAAEAGLISKPTEKQCLECHNEKSPFFEKFEVKEMFAKIKHGVKKEKEKAE